MYIRADCTEFFETPYYLHEPRLGAAALAELPNNGGRASLAQALRNLTSLPWSPMPGEHTFTKRKNQWGPAHIHEIMLSGELAGDPQLREILAEVLGKHSSRLINTTRAAITDPLFAASKGTARDCLEELNAKPKGCPNQETPLRYERLGSSVKAIY